MVIRALRLLAVNGISPFHPFGHGHFRIFQARGYTDSHATTIIATVRRTEREGGIFPDLAGDHRANFQANRSAGFFHHYTHPFSPWRVNFFRTGFIVFGLRPCQ